MVYIPAGEFKMGPDSLWSSDQNVRDVFVSGFCMDRHEVTNAEYSSYSPSPSKPKRFRGHNQPVIGVNWYDADAYCRAHGKRLPTEAEWEKAARGANGYEYGTEGGLLSHDLAHYDYKTDATADVCTYPENEYGLCDMTGNVWEWVSDWDEDDGTRVGKDGVWELHPEYAHPHVNPYRDPKGPSEGYLKILRGGSWETEVPEWLRAACRLRTRPVNRDWGMGFRCAAVPIVIREDTTSESEEDIPSAKESGRSVAEPDGSCLCNTPGYVGGESGLDISFLSLITMLFFD